MTTLGKAVHIARMKNPKSGRILTVAIDHAPSYGVLEGLENIQQVVDEVASARPDAMLMMKGVATQCFARHAGKVALIVKCSSISPYHPERDVWVASVEDALRLGVDPELFRLPFGKGDEGSLSEFWGRMFCSGL